MTHSQATPSSTADQEVLLNDPNFLREGLQRFLQQFLEEEITQFLHADPYERTEDRQGYHAPPATRYNIVYVTLCTTVFFSGMAACPSVVDRRASGTG